MAPEIRSACHIEDPGSATRPAHIMILSEEVRQGMIGWRDLLGVKAEMTHIELQPIEHCTASPRVSESSPALSLHSDCSPARMPVWQP